MSSTIDSTWKTGLDLPQQQYSTAILYSNYHFQRFIAQPKSIIHCNPNTLRLSAFFSLKSVSQSFYLV